VERLGRIVCVLVIVSLTGCLGTVVQTPAGAGPSISSTNIHLIAAPRVVDTACRNGLSEVMTYVPLWGVVVGVLTFGILVPITTVYNCAGAQSAPR
jgi:hypothetical protein